MLKKIWVILTVFLLSAAISFSATDKEMDLISSAASGDFFNVKRLVNEGINIECKSEREGTTPLLSAIEYENKDIIKFLLESGANTNNSDKFGKTPLIEAVYLQDMEVINLLVDKDADPMLSDYSKRNALKHAHDNGNNEVFMHLIGRLMMKGHRLLILAIQQNDIKLAQILLESGVKPNQTDLEGKYAIDYAIERGNYDMVKLLVNNNATLDSRDGHGYPPLIYSIKHSRPEIFDLLISSGANINSEDSDGKSALKYAINIGYIDMVKTLVNKGVKVDRKLKKYAKKYGTPKIYDYLK